MNNKPGPAVSNITEVARRAGVSSATVSRVLANKPHVRPEVRERVLQVIREQDFQPNPAARSLASRRTGIIGAAQLAEHQSSHHTA